MLVDLILLLTFLSSAMEINDEMKEVMPEIVIEAQYSMIMIYHTAHISQLKNI